MSSVTAILVAYNSRAVIGKALEALGSEPGIGRIIVVDNASADDTCTYVARDFQTWN